MSRLSFAGCKAPTVIGVVREATVREAIASMRNCEMEGADAIDLHLSCICEEQRNVEGFRAILDHARLPVLALNYNQHLDYSSFETDEESRVDLLLQCVDAGVSAIDMQAYTYDLPSKHGFRQEYAGCGYSFVRDNPKEVVMDPAVIARQMALIDRVHAAGAEVLISCHPGVAMDTEQVVDLARHLEERGPDIIKIITACNTEEELAESIRTATVLKNAVKTRVHFHSSGRMGSITRVLDPILTGGVIFCSDRYSMSSNFEQLNLKTVRAIVDNINRIR